MKKYFISLILIIAVMVWLNDWCSTGKMDEFIRDHRDPKVTPQILFLIGEVCYTAQATEAASRYFRWLLEDYPNPSNEARVRFHLAKSYEESGRRGEAMEQYVVLKDSFTSTDYGIMAKKKWELARY